MTQPADSRHQHPVMTDHAQPQHALSEAEQYWETRYQHHPTPWTVRPNAIMARWSETLPPTWAAVRATAPSGWLNAAGR